MPKDTLTFELGGRVNIEELDNGIRAFHRLVKALTPRNAGVSWIVDDLEAGSAVATLRGEADDVATVEKIVADYEHVGAILQDRGSLSDLSRSVSSAAEAVKAMANTAQYVRLATSDDEFFLATDERVTDEYAMLVSIGAVTGQVQSLSSRGSLRFNLYDSIFDKAVVCYLTTGQEDRMREVWGRRARVSGRVYREPKGTRPVAIRRIMNIELLPKVEPGTFRRAKGAVPWQPNTERGVDVIRRFRDG